jgi:hypothetical protein
MHTKCENLKGRYSLKDIDEDGRIILKMQLRETGCGADSAGSGEK